QTCRALWGQAGHNGQHPWQRHWQYYVSPQRHKLQFH
ncbi:hypothetical protein BN1708_020155, partial [Verticillium longisporum]